MRDIITGQTAMEDLIMARDCSDRSEEASYDIQNDEREGR